MQKKKFSSLLLVMVLLGSLLFACGEKKEPQPEPDPEPPEPVDPYKDHKIAIARIESFLVSKVSYAFGYNALKAFSIESFTLLEKDNKDYVQYNGNGYLENESEENSRPITLGVLLTENAKSDLQALNFPTSSAEPMLETYSLDQLHYMVTYTADRSNELKYATINGEDWNYNEDDARKAELRLEALVLPIINDAIYAYYGAEAYQYCKVLDLKYVTMSTNKTIGDTEPDIYVINNAVVLHGIAANKNGTQCFYTGVLSLTEAEYNQLSSLIGDDNFDEYSHLGYNYSYEFVLTLLNLLQEDDGLIKLQIADYEGVTKYFPR